MQTGKTATESLARTQATIPDPSTAAGTETFFVRARNVVAAYGDKIAVDDVSLDIRAGEHLSLLGPSGCGKSTLLRCIAGLETPVSGEISIGSKVVFSSANGINVPAEKRELSMVFQSYAIWPHMTVIENVGYGLYVQGLRTKELRQRAMGALKMVRMEEFADRSATELSGGQQQRVALARAYAISPQAVLLDEPLSNLDARLRVQMRSEIKALQRQTRLTTLYVTHDQEEAMAMSDQVVVMRDGRIVQTGSPLDIFDRPRTRFVADFVGEANILTGALDDHELASTPTLRVADAKVICASVNEPSISLDGLATAAVHTIFPELSRHFVEGVNRWHATVRERSLLGDIVSYIVEWPGGSLRVTTLPKDLFEEGDDVELHIPPEKVRLVAAD